MSGIQRPVPSGPIKVRTGVMGGERPMVCIPLVGRDKDTILSEARSVPSIAPDIIELRIDAWDFIEDVKKSVDMTAEVRSIVGETPIIMTCRGSWEGGIKHVSDEAKFAIYRESVAKGLVDFVDVELSYGNARIADFKKCLEGTETYLIISSHNFMRTPPEDELIEIFRAEAGAGADVLKLAVMPKREEDVLSIMSATLKIRRELPELPIISMSMSPMGALTRIVGGMFGSDLTFAVGSQASAPGQIPVAELKKCFSAVHP